MYTPKTNWVLLILFGGMTAGVFAAALLVPSFRAVSYAPLRELYFHHQTLSNIGTILNRKRGLVSEVIANFESSNARVNGHPIQIELEKMGSWEINAAVLEGASSQSLCVRPVRSRSPRF